jgi:nuclear GTP-binding protein
MTPHLGAKRELDEEELSDDEEGHANKKQRGKRGEVKRKERMTTNKRKIGVHFYETANVKNKRDRRNPNKSRRRQHQQ